MIQPPVGIRVRLAIYPLLVLALASSPASEVAARATPDYHLIRETVEGSMARYRVPGASIAVVIDSRVVWSERFGTARPGLPVTTDTLFQAASLSKPVMGLVAVALAREGALSLDSDIEDLLGAWTLPRDQATGQEPVTLRRLLSHTAGVNVPGFRGYAEGEQVPSLVEVLDGAWPANSEQIRVVDRPGVRFSYSGGGFVVAQHAIEDTTGSPLSELARAYVFGPLGLETTTFEPLDRTDPRPAIGHRSDGSPIAGGWHEHPEQAAAGLWTTPTEYAEVLIDVMDSYSAGRGTILDEEWAHLLLAADLPLGFGVIEQGGHITITHLGANEGYRSGFIGRPDRGEAVVVMTNSDSGADLVGQVMRVVSDRWRDQPVAMPAGPAGLVLGLGGVSALWWYWRRRRRRT